MELSRDDGEGCRKVRSPGWKTEGQECVLLGLVFLSRAELIQEL